MKTTFSSKDNNQNVFENLSKLKLLLIISLLIYTTTEEGQLNYFGYNTIRSINSF